MIKGNFTRIGVLSFAVMILFSACRKREDVALPDNLLVFTSSAQGINASENSIEIKVKLSRGTTSNIPVVIHLTGQGVTYGTDFTTTPAAVSNAINITVPSGNNEASFIVTKVPGVLFDGDEKLVFDIYSSGSPILIGTTKELTLNFSELVATSSSYSVNGGGITFPNKVFIDLSANRQTAVLRTNWDLGFYSDPADFRVILNSSVGMMAKQINKNDLTQVTAADTVGMSATVAYSQFTPDVSQLPYVDYPDGDLTKTAIAAVSATATDNKVYIINRGSGVGSPAPARGWKKIRIIRNASGGYTLQQADITSTTFTSVDIPKDNSFFFKYVSFDNGPVTVEPEKTKWDISWAYFGFVTNFGAGEVPYLFQDIILINRNVSVAKVMTATKAFADFNEADITGLTFSTVQTAIGSDWRAGGGPTSSPAVRTDRYYIVKDGNANYYKLRFTALTDGTGVRGYPVVEYVLVKHG